MKFIKQTNLALLMMFCISAAVTSQSIISVTPNQISRGQTLEIIVTAADVDFTQGTNLVTITKGATTYYSNSEFGVDETNLKVEFTIGSDYALGLYNLDILTHSNGALSKPNAIEIIEPSLIPSIVSVSPASAQQGDIVNVKIEGVNTSFSDNSQMVRLSKGFNAIYPSSVMADDNNTLNVAFSFSYGHSVGVYDLVVTDSKTGEVTKTAAFELLAGDNAPEIVKVSPYNVSQGITLDIEITASGVDFSQGTSLIKLSQGETTIYPNSYSVVSSAVLKANFSFNVDFPFGIYDLLIQSSDNAQLAQSMAINVNKDPNNPTLVSSTPLTGKQGQDVTLTIKGSGTRFTKNDVANKVYLRNATNTIYAKEVLPIDDETIVVVVNPEYSHPAGNYSLFLQNAYDGTQSISNQFTVVEGDNEPAVISVNSPVIVQGQTLDIEITAENIDFSKGTNLIRLNQGSTFINANSYDVKSSNVISANFSFTLNHPEGNYILSIYNSSFDVTLVDAQTLTKPQAFFLKTASVGPRISIAKSPIASVYPNPAKGVLFASKVFNRIQLYDLKGEMAVESWNVGKVDVSNLPNGIYVVILWDDDGLTTKKIVVAN